MDRLIGVHGIGYKYRTREQVRTEWVPALHGGLEWALGYRPANPPDLDIAFYGYLFRDPQDPEDSPGTANGKGALASADADLLADIDEEELSELTDAVQEIVPAADLASASTPPDKSLLWLPAPVARLVGAVERTFPGTSGALVIGELRQVGRYLKDPQLKREVDQITADAARGASVLIGHSLGSVVAYEFLRQHPDHSVSLFLTIGSPLGLRMIRTRLDGVPSVPCWVDVRDRSDPVTAAGDLSHWYPAVQDSYAENGGEAHAADRYLSSKAVGQALADVLPGLTR
jgi:pimeloyl-ACP methyl ester carboxylesterase